MIRSVYIPYIEKADSNITVCIDNVTVGTGTTINQHSGDKLTSNIKRLQDKAEKKNIAATFIIVAHENKDRTPKGGGSLIAAAHVYLKLDFLDETKTTRKLTIEKTRNDEPGKEILMELVPKKGEFHFESPNDKQIVDLGLSPQPSQDSTLPSQVPGTPICCMKQPVFNKRNTVLSGQDITDIIDLHVAGISNSEIVKLIPNNVSIRRIQQIVHEYDSKKAS